MATIPTAQSWLFQQLEGPKNTIALSGISAPHGRPRRGAVVADGVELREQTVRYAGNDQPTRHIFGVRYDDLDLTGRWKDSDLGANGAQALVEQFQQFVVDGAKIRISWGNIVSYTGFLKKFTPRRESPSDIPWDMKFVVDVPVKAPASVASSARVTPVASAKAIADALALDNVIPKVFGPPGIHLSLNTDFLDTLDDLVSSINGFTAGLVDITSQLDSLASGTAAQLARLRFGLGQAKTAVLKMRDTIDSNSDELTFAYRTAFSDIVWRSNALKFDVSTQRAIALMLEFDRDCEIAQRQKQTTSYVARLGDTWENISNRFFAGPEGANAIRQANGIKYGDLPVVGRTYTIPNSP